MAHSRKWMIVTVMLAAVSMGAGGTIAFQTAFDQKLNTVTAADHTTEINEDFPDPSPVDPEHNSEYTKKVVVTNGTGGQDPAAADCYVRISLGYSDSRIGNAVELKNLDTQNWEAGSDGFYYYRSILKSGESTTPLFTGFTVDASKIEAEDGVFPENFKIQVYEESIQAASFENYSDAWKAYEADV